MSTPFTASLLRHRNHYLSTTAKSIFKPPARWACMRFSSTPSRSLGKTWKRWAFLYCRRLWNQPSPVRWARVFDRIRKLNFPHCYKEGSRKKARSLISPVRRSFLARCLRRIRASSQSLELLHFMLCGCRFSLFPIVTCQPEIRLRRQRTILFDQKNLRPFFHGPAAYSLHPHLLPHPIHHLRHFSHPPLAPQTLPP